MTVAMCFAFRPVCTGALADADPAVPAFTSRREGFIPILLGVNAENQYEIREAKVKYIIFEDFSGQAIPVLFPDRIEHGELREQMPYSTVLSAGFVNTTQGGFVCHGESKSLGAAAAKGDAEVIARHFQQGAD